MSAIQLAGVLLIAGSVTVWPGAALPTWRVFVTADPEVRAKLISDRDAFWILSHLLFLIGPVVTAIGMGVFTSTVESVIARPLALVGLAAFVLGTLVWGHIVLAFRLLMLGKEYVRTTGGAWTFPTYTLLTLGALILYAIVLLLSSFPTWLGLVTIGLSSLLLIAFLIQKDSGPPLFYIPILIMGIVFLS